VAVVPDSGNREIAMRPAAVSENRTTWRVGARVSRKISGELGAVVEIEEKIKVRWDTGQPSYFRHGQQANVQLETVKE
jgi:hypothetical protein